MSDKMNIQLTQSQINLVKARSSVTIFAEGRCQGATTGLLFKAAINDVGHSLFISGYTYHNEVKTFCGILEDFDISYTVKEGLATVKVSWYNETSSVTFISGSEAVRYLRTTPNISTVLVDNIDYLHSKDPSFMRMIYSQKDKYKLAFTTNPFYCGYRTPKLTNGVHEQNIDSGEWLYTKDKSWDYYFVNWQAIDKMDAPTPRLRASKDNYKHYVTIINNGNTVLRQDYDYRPLSWLEKMEFKGEWV